VYVTPINDAIKRLDTVVSLTYQVNSTDPFYNNRFGGTVVIAATDNDLPGFALSKTVVTCVVDLQGMPSLPCVYTVHLTSEPAADVVIALGAPSVDTVVSPAQLVLNSRNYQTPQTVNVTAFVNDVEHVTYPFARIETITHTVTTADRFYNALKCSNVTVQVAVSADTALPPALAQVIMSDALQSIMVTFNSATNRPTGNTTVTAAGALPGEFPCSAVVDTDLTAGLGDKPFCSWASAEVMQIRFGASPTFVPGPSSAVRLHDNVVKNAAKLSSVYATGLHMACAFPTHPTPVTVALSAPQTVGICDPVSLDGDLTTGSGGRSLRYRWMLSGTFNPAPANVTALDALAALLSATSGSRVTVPNDVLSEGTFYNFTLQVSYTNGSKLPAALQFVIMVSRPNGNVLTVHAMPCQCRTHAFHGTLDVSTSLVVW
jgi:hypothetical protein